MPCYGHKVKIIVVHASEGERVCDGGEGGGSF